MPSPCNPRGTLVELAITSLIKELVALADARRHRRRARACQPCPTTPTPDPEVTP